MSGSGTAPNFASGRKPVDRAFYSLYLGVRIFYIRYRHKEILDTLGQFSLINAGLVD